MKARTLYTLAALAVCAVVLYMAPDPASAASMMLLANAPAALEMEVLKKALAEHGVAWKAFMDKQTDTMNELKARTLEVEQKLAHKPTGEGGASDDPLAELAELIVSSDNTKTFLNSGLSNTKVQVPMRLMKAAIFNATGQNQPLVPADRRIGVVRPVERRMTIRDLFTQLPTSSNLIEFTRELVFSNNAGPQWDASSPTPGQEGAIKNESSITFELATVALTLIAHWIPASRQVLSDAPMLQRYLDDRLIYGLRLEEEDEMINGSGGQGELSGLVTNATAFTGGSTNITALDALALAVGQLSASEQMPTAFVINPLDWWSDKIRLLKDSTGRYILGDPQNALDARLWNIPVVITNSMARGSFLALDAPRTGWIADREDAEVRISDQHADFFIRNMVAVRAELRTALVIERPSSIIYGSLSYAG